MNQRLVLLVGDFGQTDSDVVSVLTEWAGAGILGSVAWTSCTPENIGRPFTRFANDGQVEQLELFELLTSRIWSQVSVVAVRQQVVGSLALERFANEERLLKMVEGAFEAHKDLEFQSFTVSIADEHGLVSEAFSPFWMMHILHEPIVRIDRVVAAHPMWGDHRHLLVTLLALTMSGGFVWQHGALAPNMKDQVDGVSRPVRVARAYLRVVSAGRLTDEVLAGAFPKSGHWSIPTDVANALAVPPGTAVPESLVSVLVQRGKFHYLAWKDPKRERPKSIGLVDGLKLFAREFGRALKGIPSTFAERVKSEIETFVQKATFGANASVLLRFDPQTDNLDADDAVEAIRNSQLGSAVDPVGDTEPWVALQRVALGVVDGGRFPDGVAPPVRGSSRLIFTDPSAIGPAPDDEPFHITPFEISLLNLEESHSTIGAMAVADALTLKTHLEAVRSGLVGQPAEAAVQTDGASGSTSVRTQEAGGKKGRRFGLLWRIRRWRAKRRTFRKAARSAASSTPTVTRGASPSTTPGHGSPVNAVGPTNSDGSVEPDAPSVVDESRTDVVGRDVDEDETDRHSPSHPMFRSSEYTPIGVFYQGARPELVAEYADANRVYEAAQSSYPAIRGRFAKNKTCDHCGTAFDHGLLYLHEPSKKLVRVGNVCARKAMPDPGDIDIVATRLIDLERRFGRWISARSSSLLWRVGESIVASLVTARVDLARCLQILADRPALEEATQVARGKFGRWTRRGLFAFMLVIAATLASVVFTPVPLLIAVLLVTTYFSGFVVRMLYLARDIVRAQYKFRLAMDEYERSYSRARHDVQEVVRLSSVQEQFDDWQIVLRQIVHQPFGQEIGFATARVGVDDVTRPPAMVLGKSRPDEKQSMQLFLQARRQTIHAGWLLEILDMLKDEWRRDYENARLTTSADNILPEADNAPSKSVVGKRPLSEEDVFYPRTDFRLRVTEGGLQRVLVAKKAEQVAVELRQTSLAQLLANVEVSGLGAALSGQRVEAFLSGLAQDSHEKISFPPDLISDSHANFRSMFDPELVLPMPGSLDSDSGHIQVQPGVELTAAAWRVELSAPLERLEILRGFGEPYREDGE